VSKQPHPRLRSRWRGRGEQYVRSPNRRVEPYLASPSEKGEPPLSSASEKGDSNLPSASGRVEPYLPSASGRAEPHPPSPSEKREPYLPCPSGRGAWDEGGFAFIAALFLLVVLGAFVAFVISISMNAQSSGALAVQGTRAYEAARAGVEWATYQILDPRQAINGVVTTPPACFASPSTPALPGQLGQFSLTVSCTRYPSNSASPNYYEEASLRVAVYDVTSTATQGTPGAADYVERQIQVRIEQCKDPNAASPGYVCQ
jgi:MSHA biogenesis protein MshP